MRMGCESPRKLINTQTCGALFVHCQQYHVTDTTAPVIAMTFHAPTQLRTTRANALYNRPATDIIYNRQTNEIRETKRDCKRKQ